jgi:hypothetical protein
MKLKEIKDLTYYSDIIKLMVRQKAKEIRRALPQGVRKAFLQGDDLWVITKDDEVYSLTVSSENPKFDRIFHRVFHPVWNDVVIMGIVTDSFIDANRLFADVKGTVEDIKKIGDIILMGDIITRVDITDKEQIIKELNELEFKRTEYLSCNSEVVKVLKNVGCLIVNGSFRFGKYRFALSKNYLTEMNVTNRKFRYSDSLERRLKKFLLEKMI